MLFSFDLVNELVLGIMIYVRQVRERLTCMFCMVTFAIHSSCTLELLASDSRTGLEPLPSGLNFRFVQTKCN